MSGHCEVEFTVDGRTVVADLPAGSGGGKRHVGAELTVRYEADDPRVVAREEDVDGGGAAVFTVLSALGAVFFLVLSGIAAGARRREGRKGRVQPVT
ncbi:hypothetical protein ACPCTK_10730 [Streptomyces pseudogriseolus]|uniref:hypothetical protein n=1 Tax=Streptomyces pseudogriseolus TaxID=36817 RepID=UPI003FA3132E